MIVHVLEGSRLNIHRILRITIDKRLLSQANRDSVTFERHSGAVCEDDLLVDVVFPVLAIDVNHALTSVSREVNVYGIVDIDVGQACVLHRGVVCKLPALEEAVVVRKLGGSVHFEFLAEPQMEQAFGSSGHREDGAAGSTGHVRVEVAVHGFILDREAADRDVRLGAREYVTAVVYGPGRRVLREEGASVVSTAKSAVAGRSHAPGVLT